MKRVDASFVAEQLRTEFESGYELERTAKLAAKLLSFAETARIILPRKTKKVFWIFYPIDQSFGGISYSTYPNAKKPGRDNTFRTKRHTQTRVIPDEKGTRMK